MTERPIDWIPYVELVRSEIADPAARIGCDASALQCRAGLSLEVRVIGRRRGTRRNRLSDVGTQPRTGSVDPQQMLLRGTKEQKWRGRARCL